MKTLLLLALTTSAFAMNFEAHTMAKGEWISKLLTERGLNSKEMMSETLKYNQMDMNTAKKIAVGSTVYLPTMEKMTELEEVSQEIKEVAAAPLKTDITSKKMNMMDKVKTTAKSIVGSIEVGSFYQDQKLENYTADFNSNYYVGAKIGKKFFSNSKVIPTIGAKVWGKFHDNVNLKNIKSIDVDPSFGMDLTTGVDFIKAVKLTPSIRLEQTANLHQVSNNNIIERRDRNGWLGLQIDKKIANKVNLFANANHLLATDRRKNAENLERLRGQRYGAGLEISMGDILTTLYHDHNDFEGTSLRNSKEYGLRMGYQF